MGIETGEIMKHWKKLASALAIVAASPAPAQVATYDFDFNVWHSNSPNYAVGTIGTGRLVFQESSTSSATQTYINAAYYGNSAAYVDLTINGTTTRLIDLPGNLSGQNGPFVADQTNAPPAFYQDFFLFTRDQEVALGIYGAATSLTDYSLTAANLDKIWANRAGTDINFGNDTHARITALRAVSGVPEPATWGMLLLGFGLIGAAMRRPTTKVYRIA